MATFSSHSQASLLSLPDELLLDILKYIDQLEYPRRTKALYGLNLTNRRLHGLSQPYLYSTFSFHAGVPYLFLRTICQNQDLASHVKVIEWDYDSSASEIFNYKPGVLAVKQQFELDDVADKLTQMAVQGNKVAKWILEELKLGRVYLGDIRALHVLLMFAPNVEHLGVVETYRWDDHSYWFMPIEHGHIDALSFLTSATLNGPMRLQNVTALLTLPTMRRLELTQVIEMRQEQGRWLDWESPFDNRSWKRILNKCRSNIEHFHLYNSCVNLKDVEVAVRAMKSLKSFVYEHDWNELSAGFVRFDLEALSELMMCQSHSLATVRIVYKCSRGDFELHNDPDLLYKTVPFLPKLVNLELPHASMVIDFQTPEWQDLPVDLQHLTLDAINLRPYFITQDFTNLEQNLEALAVLKRRGELPSLRTLTLRRWHPWYGCVPTNVSRIKTLLRDAGVQFSTMPAEIGSSDITREDIGWVELHTEPEWVLIEKYFVDDQ